MENTMQQAYTVGTACFVSFDAAMKYYAPYEGMSLDNSEDRRWMRELVQEKVDSGTIHIGPPAPNETVSINSEGRYLLHVSA